MSESIEHNAGLMFEALRAGRLKPLLSATQAMDLDTGYRVQGKLIEQLAAEDEIAGFKAALSNEAAQKNVGSTSPVFGVLFKSGVRQPGSTVKLEDFQRPVVETEIGYLVNSTVSAPVSLDSVWDVVAPLPMIELADPGFEAGGKMTAADLVSGNSASAAYIPGSVSSRPDDLDGLPVLMMRDGETLSEGFGRDAMGSQTHAVCWLINEALVQGYQLQQGQYLMTGALGKPQPGLPGHYVGDYGEFGRIEFDIE